MGKFSDAFCALALQQFLIQYEILLTYYKGVRGGGGGGGQFDLPNPHLIGPYPKSSGIIIRFWETAQLPLSQHFALSEK